MSARMDLISSKPPFAGLMGIVTRIALRKLGLLSTVAACAVASAVSAAPRGANDTNSSGESVVEPAQTFVILLSGPYHPVVHGPDLGLSLVNLSDGSYSRTKIFPVSGLPEEDRGHANRGIGPGDRDDETETAIGNFYVHGKLAAYDLPGGALAMAFKENNLKAVPDGQGGTYFVGDLKLDILEATGIYKSFVGGHNHMVDILHKLADGTFVEHCFCIISLA